MRLLALFLLICTCMARIAQATPCVPASPRLVEARSLAQGCYQAENNISYTNPAGAQALLLVRLENGSGEEPMQVSYGGAAMQLLLSNQDFSHGLMRTYVLSSPPKGARSLEIDYAHQGCSWNVVVEAYRRVDPFVPVGASVFNQSQGACPDPGFTLKVDTLAPNSLLSDFMVVDVLPANVQLGPGQADFAFATGCCDNVRGDYKKTGAAGPAELDYTFSQCKRWSSQLVELRGRACGAEPTVTPTPGPTPYADGAGPNGGPQLVDARSVAQACYQAANSIAYENPGPKDALLVLRLEDGSGAAPTLVSYGGSAMTLLRRDKDFSGGTMRTYILKNPPAGKGPLEINYARSGCSWNVVLELYTGVDESEPIAADQFAHSRGECPDASFTLGLKTSRPNCLLSDFMAVDVLPATVILGSGQTDLNLQTGCCDNVRGDIKVTAAAGKNTTSYAFSQCKRWSSQLLAIQGTSRP